MPRYINLSEEKARITLQIWQEVLGTNFMGAIFDIEEHEGKESIVAQTTGHGTLKLEDGSQIEVSFLKLRFDPIIVLEDGETKRRWQVPEILEVISNGNHNDVVGEVSYQICFKMGIIVNEVCPQCRAVPNTPCDKCRGRGVIPNMILRAKP